MLEVGSYRGGSAAFLARARDAVGSNAALHVVDTFAGHPEAAVGSRDGEAHVPGHFGDTSFEEVRDYLSPFTGLELHRGSFAEVREALDGERFAFAHIDTDLYGPTIGVLDHLVTRMPAGGTIVVDDWASKKCPGVRAATDEFLAGRDDFVALSPMTEQLVLIRAATGADSVDAP